MAIITIKDDEAFERAVAAGTKENCLVCCFTCNRMKSNMSYTAFLVKVWQIGKKHGAIVSSRCTR